MRHRGNSAENYQYLRNARKTYKKCINKKFNQYKEDFIKKVRILNNLIGTYLIRLINLDIETLKKISLKAFAEHFKKLNINKPLI